jgi:hypothetical protein
MSQYTLIVTKNVSVCDILAHVFHYAAHIKLMLARHAQSAMLASRGRKAIWPPFLCSVLQFQVGIFCFQWPCHNLEQRPWEGNLGRYCSSGKEGNFII